MAETDYVRYRATLDREVMAFVLDRRPYCTWSLIFITFTAWVLMESFVGGQYGYVGSADVRVMWAAGALDQRQVSAGVRKSFLADFPVYRNPPLCS